MFENSVILPLIGSTNRVTVKQHLSSCVATNLKIIFHPNGGQLRRHTAHKEKGDVCSGQASNPYHLAFRHQNRPDSSKEYVRAIVVQFKLDVQKWLSVCERFFFSWFVRRMRHPALESTAPGRCSILLARSRKIFLCISCLELPSRKQPCPGALPRQPFASQWSVGDCWHWYQCPAIPC